jgi:hypothetical protein
MAITEQDVKPASDLDSVLAQTLPSFVANERRTDDIKALAAINPVKHALDV